MKLGQHKLESLTNMLVKEWSNSAHACSLRVDGNIWADFEGRPAESAPPEKTTRKVSPKTGH